MSRMFKTHTQEKLIEFVDKKWYVKHTNAEVVIRNVEAVYPFDRADLRYIVDIEFLQDYPDERALRICNAIPEDVVQMSYAGHPVQPGIRTWIARVDLEYLCNVPFGTKAAEILFGKK